MTDDKVKAIRGDEPSSNPSVSAATAADVFSFENQLAERLKDPEWLAKWNADEQGLLSFQAMLNALRRDEGDSITLFCDNPDFNGQPNNAVECCGDWTRWADKRFTGDSLLLAVRAAYLARLAAGQSLTGQAQDGSSHQKDDALQAERDKLSAEVEAVREQLAHFALVEPTDSLQADVRDTFQALAATAQRFLADSLADKAKLTALVEASEEVSGLVHEERSGALHVAKGNGPAFSAAIRRLRQALAHHSVSVVEGVPGICGETGEPCSKADQDCAHDCLGKPPSHPKAAPPTTPTSAPVEDVGGLVERVFGSTYMQAIDSGYLPAISTTELARLIDAARSEGRAKAGAKRRSRHDAAPP